MRTHFTTDSPNPDMAPYRPATVLVMQYAAKKPSQLNTKATGQETKMIITLISTYITQALTVKLCQAWPVVLKFEQIILICMPVLNLALKILNSYELLFYEIKGIRKVKTISSVKWIIFQLLCIFHINFQSSKEKFELFTSVLWIMVRHERAWP